MSLGILKCKRIQLSSCCSRFFPGSNVCHVLRSEGGASYHHSNSVPDMVCRWPAHKELHLCTDAAVLCSPGCRDRTCGSHQNAIIVGAIPCGWLRSNANSCTTRVGLCNAPGHASSGVTRGRAVVAAIGKAALFFSSATATIHHLGGVQEPSVFTGIVGQLFGLCILWWASLLIVGLPAVPLLT